MQRRQFLKTAAVSTLPATAITGCASDSGDPSTPSDSNDGSSTPTDQRNSPSDGESTADPSPTRTPSEDPTSTPDRSASVAAGELVEGEQMSMVVKSVRTTDSLGEFQEAESGNTYLVVRLEVKNRTTGEFADFSQFLQTELQDGEGYTYTPTISLSDSAFQGGQLAPGEVARGDVAFEIPEEASGLSLRFDFSAFSFFSYDSVSVDLERTASRVADLTQNLQVDVHDVGVKVTHEGVAVTVNDVEFVDSLGEFTTAPEGKTFAIVDVTTANESEEAVNFSSLLQMSVKDGTGLSYSFSAMALGALTRSYDGGEVAPGERRRGKVAYEVATDASPLYFIFEFSILESGTRTFWKIR